MEFWYNCGNFLKNNSNNFPPRHVRIWPQDQFWIYNDNIRSELFVCFFLIHHATHCHRKHMGPFLDLFCLAPCRQVLPSSSCMSREAGSWVQRREPTPGQSTWGRETLWALFPLWRLHVKWVLAWWDTQTPLEGKALHSLPPIEERDTEGLLKMHLWSWHRRRLCLFQYTQQ